MQLTFGRGGEAASVGADALDRLAARLESDLCAPDDVEVAAAPRGGGAGDRRHVDARRHLVGREPGPRASRGRAPDPGRSAVVRNSRRAAMSESSHITHDPLYNTVDRDDFRAMIEVRALRRTHRRLRRDHLRDRGPLLGSARPDLRRLRAAVRPREQRSCRASSPSSCNARSPTGSTTSQQIALANESTRFSLSSILHGEQGALSLSAQPLPDLAATRARRSTPRTRRARRRAT